MKTETRHDMTKSQPIRAQLMCKLQLCRVRFWMNEISWQATGVQCLHKMSCRSSQLVWTERCIIALHLVRTQSEGVSFWSWKHKAMAFTTASGASRHDRMIFPKHNWSQSWKIFRAIIGNRTGEFFSKVLVPVFSKIYIRYFQKTQPRTVYCLVFLALFIKRYGHLWSRYGIYHTVTEQLAVKCGTSAIKMWVK